MDLAVAAGSRFGESFGATRSGRMASTQSLNECSHSHARGVCVPPQVET